MELPYNEYTVSPPDTIAYQIKCPVLGMGYLSSIVDSCGFIDTATFWFTHIISHSLPDFGG